MFHHIRGLERACKVVVAVPALDVRVQLESKFHWKVCYRRLDFIIFSHIFTYFHVTVEVVVVCKPALEVGSRLRRRVAGVHLSFMPVWTLFQGLLSL